MYSVQYLFALNNFFEQCCLETMRLTLCCCHGYLLTLGWGLQTLTLASSAEQPAIPARQATQDGHGSSQCRLVSLCGNSPERAQLTKVRLKRQALKREFQMNLTQLSQLSRLAIPARQATYVGWTRFQPIQTGGPEWQLR